MTSEQTPGTDRSPESNLGSIDLVTRIAAGDASAVTSLYDATCSAVFGVLLRVLEDREAAEEALLNTYTEAWRRAGDRAVREPVAWLLEIALASGLRHGAPETAPPDYLRDLLAARVEREPRLLPASPPPEEAAPLQVNLESAPRFVESPFSSVRHPVAASQPKPVLPWILAAAGALVAVVTLAAWLQSRRAAAQQEELLAAARQQNTRLQEAAVKQESGSALELRRLRDIVTSARRRTIVLSAQPLAPASLSATLIWDRVTRRCLVTGFVPPAPAGKDYQLWFTTPAGRLSGGVLEPDAAGRCYKIIELPAGAAESTEAAITLEPDGGSPRPTSIFHALGRSPDR